MWGAHPWAPHVDRSMHKYVIRRLLLAVPVLVLASLIVFGLMRVMPGDALTALVAESGNVSERELAKLRRDLGLDKPYYQQYLIWMWQMVSLNPGYSIFTSFLGLGTQPPIPSWGLMLSSTGRAFMEQAPGLAVFPGLAISLAVLGFNLFGDTLRDAWDPKLRSRG